MFGDAPRLGLALQRRLGQLLLDGQLRLDGQFLDGLHSLSAELFELAVDFGEFEMSACLRAEVLVVLIFVLSVAEVMPAVAIFERSFPVFD